MPVKTIHSKVPSVYEYWNELRKYKSLIWVFAAEEIKANYAQTYFGLAWAVMRPLVTLLVFTVLFKLLLKMETTIPYYLFAFAGMIAWNLFSNIASNAAQAVVQKQSLIRKMYFPKIILLFSKVLVACFEMAISLVLVFVMMLFEGLWPQKSLLAFPFFLLLNIMCGLLIAVWMSALNIRFRDLNQIIPPLIGMGIWFTPVFYPTTLIPQQYHFALWLNPMAGVIKGYRFCLFGEPFPEWQFFVCFFVLALATFAGIWYFMRMEDKMADYA